MTTHKRIWKRAVTCAVLGGLMVFSPAAESGPLPLPEPMQVEVNRAIEHGVDFLKATQGPFGSWNVGRNQVGYAALPGLTLLECGVKAADPLVQKAAGFVRYAAGGLDTTYDLSLAILFLDKLGDPRDKEIIQMLALRLVAGQTGTGGWSYRCPVLTKQDHKDVLKLLRKLNPPELFKPLPREGERDNPLFIERPGHKDMPRALPGGKDLPRALPGGGKPGPLQGIPNPGTPGRESDNDPLRSQRPPSPGESPAAPVPPAPQREKAAARPKTLPAASVLFPAARCIKMADAPSPAAVPAPAQTKPSAKPAKPARAQRITVPPHLLRLAVFNDPVYLPLLDPQHKLEAPLWGTTDNSNSQFAVLALWTARKHDVPMTRTLNLIARRYYTSQAFNGAWGYRYQFGGGMRTSPPMTCVGLLGLAVAHGLVSEEDERHGIRPKLVQDPRVIAGFVALNQSIGQPTGAWKNLPMQNLYFLWSVERVGMLFDLNTIGDKDWYRWGAEILLANQRPDGNWDGGGYHAHNPIIDTCLAVLFLKRASFTGDLGQKLPFRAQDLWKAIKAAPPPPILAENPGSEVKQGTLATEAVAKSSFSEGPHATAKSDRVPAVAAPAPITAALPTEAPLPAVAEEPSSAWVVWLLGGVALLFVTAGAVILLLPARRKKTEKRRSRRKRVSPRFAEG